MLTQAADQHMHILIVTTSAVTNMQKVQLTAANASCHRVLIDYGMPTLGNDITHNGTSYLKADPVHLQLA